MNATLGDTILDQLASVYPQDAERISVELSDFAGHFTENYSRQDSTKLRPDWYKNIQMYVVYPNSIQYGSSTGFSALEKHLEYIKLLGCNAIHVLPFLQSPMIDGGFDVSDYLSINSQFGDHKDLISFLDTARSLGIQVFMDMVLNHVSAQHPWFQQAQAGSDYYREYFFSRPDKPKFLRKFSKDSAVWAEYEENGKEVLASIVLPEQAGEIPHWLEGKDGNWYYHTFYPEQLDVNWLNPQVFIEYAKILVHWAQLGFSFRLDAIPFVGKTPYKNSSQASHTTHKLVAALNTIIKHINPQALILVESYERLPSIISYFGETNRPEAELAYNFFLCTNLWLSVVTQSADHTWEILAQMQNVPDHAGWLNFLRSHDELSLSYLPEDLRKEVYAKLEPYGEPFRGEFGVTGRTFAFAGGDMRKFLMLYFLLASLPGAIAIPFGDELAAASIPLNELPANLGRDTRNINRGSITTELLNSTNGKYAYQVIAEILNNRRELVGKFQTAALVRIKSPNIPKSVFAGKYSLNDHGRRSELIVLINLAAESSRINLDVSEFTKVAQVNSVDIKTQGVILEPYGSVWLQK